jgi:PAS domain S-box-containing protein
MALKRFSRKPNVLAVDDKRANLIALEATLGDEYNVRFAHSGREAIDLVDREPEAVDLILMDVQMPEMDGFEAASRIKNRPGCQDIPIIFVTAVFTEDPFVKRGYEAGGIDYFSKPFDPDVLRMKIAVYASYRLQDEVLKAREKSIRESEELLRVGRKLSLLLEGLPIGVLISDVEGRICQTTEEVTRILGAMAPTRDDAYGEILGWWDASGRMLKDDEGPLARALRHGERSHSKPLQIRSLEGSSKTVLISASPLRGLDGRIVGAVVLVQDLTESKKVIEQELERRVTNLISLGVELEESAMR